MLKPATVAFPAVGPKIPVIIEISVVFPAPFGPSNPKIVRSSTARYSWFTASLPLSYFFVRPRHIRGKLEAF